MNATCKWSFRDILNLVVFFILGDLFIYLRLGDNKNMR